jgi:Dolichyl-phosphate-mannose-protein mannosyltransferase
MIASRHNIGKYLPLLLFIFFVLITLPGISWGTPNLWHPDEQVKVADRAIRGLIVLDTSNFNQPSLAKYTMYWLGRLVYWLGFSRAEFIQAARAVSVILGGLVVLLVYLIARESGAATPFSIFAAFLVLSSSQMAANARFAHTDIYLAFFSTLGVFFLLKYRSTGYRLWLYASFLTVGLAASSKYNGISLLAAVLLVFLIHERSKIRTDRLRFLETLIIGLGLTFAGYVIGTPRMLLAMSFYTSNVIKALIHQATYGYETGDRIGMLGQWDGLVIAWGWLEFGLFLLAVLWGTVVVVRSHINRSSNERQPVDSIGVLLLCALAVDLPVMVSYNYPDRFLLHLLPILSVLAGLFVQEIYTLAKRSGRKSLVWLAVLLPTVVLLVGFLRVTSIVLLFFNDNRIAASRFLETLPKGSSIEYTLYEPNISDKKFKKFNYPLFFQDHPDQEPPEGKAYQWNQGEEGIESRRPDYFIVDNFTYQKFDDPIVCHSLPNECVFFQRLLADQTNYSLIQKFDYRLPFFLPQLKPSFLNPEILVFQREPD